MAKQNGARRPRGSKNPTGGWTPSSDSNALRAVEALPVCTGAKAAAEAATVARTASFIMVAVKGWQKVV